MTIKIIISGINGRMGRVVRKGIETQSDFALVAGTSRRDNLVKAIEKTHANVVIDFTTPQSVFHNAELIIQSGARPVIGTTGLTLEKIAILDKQCRAKKIGGIVAPNFAVGALLMMRYAREAAYYFPDVEIIEMHHPEKVDVPSGTAIKTAQMIKTTRFSKKNKSFKNHTCTHDEIKQDIAIHSVRLPGLFSHQSVIFGRNGETLTIRHDSINRSCILPGVFLSCRKVMKLDYLVHGLENFIQTLNYNRNKLVCDEEI